MDAPSPSSRRAESLARPFVWRGLAFTAVYLVSLIGFATGVGVSERDLLDAGLAERAYYALGLFVLGGLDLGTPTGGPAVGRALLWVGYFLAPAITASALVEALVRLVGPLTFRIRPLAGHIVVAGAGRLSLVYVRKLRRRDRRRTVVVVERDPNHPRLTELSHVHKAVVVIGDITRDAILRAVRTEHAHRIVLLTGDDFANLDAAAKILRQGTSRSRRIVTHVSDLGFMRETAESSVARNCEVFNGHQFAASNLVREHLIERFRATPHQDLVVLAGFGRFGRTVLHELQEHAAGSFGPVVIIDQNASRNAREFAAEPGFCPDYDHTVIDGDLLDPELWRRVGEVVKMYGHDPVIVVGSGEDGTNLNVALSVAKQHPDALVISRSFRASPFAAEVTREAGVHAFNLAELIESGMPAEWF